MIEVVLLVATLVIPGQPGSTRTISADWPFFRSMEECRRAVMRMERSPRIVDTVMCEPHTLDTGSGRIVR
jgi:hypothetical protein